MNNICLGIIPARGGSKSIPHKNIREVGGKPLIAWTIEVALKSEKLDRVIVSTDDEEIALISQQWGVKVPFMRPPELARDDTPTLPVLRHAVSSLEAAESYVPDVIVVLQPTSPLRRTEHIDQAVELLLQTRADSVVSICHSKHSPYWMKRLEGNRVFPFLNDVREYTRRQDLPAVYRLNGAVYATRYGVLMKQNRILGDDTRALVMDSESSIDIDSYLDFRLAEILLAERTNE
jgi:N-acylneuraminate cytidylyltransferase/CMP-N,N'-diacetyllegionaminic acid synthase